MAGVTRRQWLTTGTGAAIGLGLGAAYRGRPESQEARVLVRPPGARDEEDFLARCIRCGQCAQACPPEYNTLTLLTIDAGTDAGTPCADDLRSRPCFLCQGHSELKCIAACPTGALDEILDARDIRMGIAVIDEQTCWAFTGILCRACWHACPWPDEAITLNERLRPIVDTTVCVGCGLCEHACPVEPSAIVITRERDGSA